MQQTQGHINPNATRLGRQASPEDNAPRIQVNLHDLTSLIIRLAQILAQEVDALENMRIKEIEGMMEDKNRLVRTIAAMKRELDRTPDFLDNCHPEEVESFRKVSRIFEHIMNENHRKLLVAKEINGSIVQAISEAVREEALRTGYNRKGKSGVDRDLTPSVSLNKTI